MIGIQNSFLSIPNQCLSEIRIYLISLLEKMKEFPNDLSNHKKFTLILTILFTSLQGTSSERINEIRNRLNILKNDNYFSMILVARIVMIFSN